MIPASGPAKQPVVDALRPMTLGELLDRTFSLYRKHFALFIGLVALPNLAMLAFQLANVAVRTQTTFSFSLTFLLTTLGTVILSMVVYSIVLAVSQGATVIAVSQLHLGKEVTISDAFAGIRSRVAMLCLTMLTVGIAVVFASILLIVPGILLALMWSLALPVVVLERKGVRDSMSRSSFLTKGNRGRIFVIYFLFIVLAYILYSLWEVPITVAAGLYSPAIMVGSLPVWVQIAFAVGAFVTQCISGPLLTIALSLVYYDERVRKEAFDLEHMMSQLDGATG